MEALCGKLEPKVEAAIVSKTYDGLVRELDAIDNGVGIADAVKGVNSPTIEVHISNTKSREDFRKQSFISPNAKGVIQGFGLYSYDLAILSFLSS